ncbi:2-dehydropantoate 2-reductase [Bacillus songklensis]|uniref:2-dehydropantoate 2-reductase n=1 Tax=Bacillus songklensis TaxID=1069116 RepID=A0ABV8AYT6_9BACI
MKKIAIIGGGSVGLLFTAYLSKKFDVMLYTRTKEQAQAIRREGLSLVNKGAVQRIEVQAHPLSEGIFDADLVVIAVKQYHMEDVLSAVDPQLKKDVPLLFVQNGMGHIHKIKESKYKHVLLGIVEHGALKNGENEIHHKGIGATKIACYRGDDRYIEELLERQIDFFPFIQEENWYGMLVTKLVVNACINPLTALYRVTNGQLVENSFYQQNLQVVFKEVAEALNLIDASSYWTKVINICRQTALNRSSMLRDIEERRETEIEAILGYVLQEARSRDVSTPSLNFLYKSIKGMEKRGGG